MKPTAILLLLAPAVVLLTLGFLWPGRNQAALTIDENISSQGIPNIQPSKWIQPRLMQRLTKPLEQYPNVDRFRLYVNDSDICSLEYDRRTQTLSHVEGNAKWQCVRYTYENVSPAHIYQLVKKRESAQTLRQFGCAETSYVIGGGCDE
jgi:hypothetical protein